MPADHETIAITSFGVDVDVRLEADDGDGLEPLLAAVEALLPPGARRRPIGPDPTRSPTVGIRRTAAGLEVDPGDGTGPGRWSSEADGLHALDAAIRAIVSLQAPDHVFVHAGVVGLADGALVLPGRSFAGKTTLVQALLLAGATYLSDEYAVLAPDGTVLPYPRRLSVRSTEGRQELAAAGLGAVVATDAQPVATVAALRYVAGSRWAVTEGSAGACALALVDNAVAARTRSAAVLAAAAAVARRARFLEGERGEVAEAVEHLLA